MSWLDILKTPIKNPFKKEEDAAAAPEGAPELPKELASMPGAKGLMGMFYRKWKDPAFMRQLQALAAHMAKDGVDLKDQGQVKTWLEKNKDALTSDKFKNPPDMGEKPATFVKTGPDVGRNDPCPCGSGKKFKKCCANKPA